MMSKCIIVLLLMLNSTMIAASEKMEELKRADEAPNESIADIKCYLAMTVVHQNIEEPIEKYGVSICKKNNESNTISISLKKSVLSFGGRTFYVDISTMTIIQVDNER